MKDLLARAEPNIDEILFALILASAGGLIFFTVFDISIHDGYVLDDISKCFVGNIEESCLFLQEEHGCDGLNQLCIGERYWATLNGIVLFFGGTLAVMRFVFGKLAGADTNFNLFAVSGMWFLSGTILFYTGWLDYFYYVFQDITIPNKLPWLNEAGGFSVVKIFGNDANIVEKSDMYILMGIGVGILAGLWALLVHHHRKGKLEEWGLI